MARRAATATVGTPTGSARILEGDGEAPTRLAARTDPPAERPTWAEVDLDAVAHNVAVLAGQSPAAHCCAVVKADAYGHGLLPVTRAAREGGADWFGVALVEEAAALRAGGVTAPVLVFTEPPQRAVDALLDARATPTVYTPEIIAALDAAAAARRTTVGVHLKLDTGMRRVGVPEPQWEEVLQRVMDAPHLRLEGVWSHLAVADEPGHAFTDRQADAFRRGLELARSLGGEPELAHLCNSAGTLLRPDDHFDMIRPGIAIYGIAPAPGIAEGFDLRPALSWYSRLSLVKRVAAGEAASYGLTWTAAGDTTLGTVPAGYADGVARRLSNVGTVLHRGRRVPMVATVCMDQFLVDLGRAPATVGDEVVLLGRQGDARVSAEDIAAVLGTIGYEVVCGIGARVPRTYVGAAGVGG